MGLSLKRLRERVLWIPARLLLHGRRAVLIIGQWAVGFWQRLWKKLLSFQSVPAG